MLQELDIRNYALINKLQIDLSPGLNILFLSFAPIANTLSTIAYFMLVNEFSY